MKAKWLRPESARWIEEWIAWKGMRDHRSQILTKRKGDSGLSLGLLIAAD